MHVISLLTKILLTKQLQNIPEPNLYSSLKIKDEQYCLPHSGLKSPRICIYPARNVTNYHYKMSTNAIPQILGNWFSVLGLILQNIAPIGNEAHWHVSVWRQEFGDN